VGACYDPLTHTIVLTIRSKTFPVCNEGSRLIEVAPPVIHRATRFDPPRDPLADASAPGISINGKAGAELVFGPAKDEPPSAELLNLVKRNLDLLMPPAAAEKPAKPGKWEFLGAP
jgi:hypothetical protein